jgi:hypothetical protein
MSDLRADFEGWKDNKHVVQVGVREREVSRNSVTGNNRTLRLVEYGEQRRKAGVALPS